MPRRGRVIGIWAPAGVWKMRTRARLIWNSKDWAGSLAAGAFSLQGSSNTSSRVKTRELSSFRRLFICEDCNCWRNHRSGEEILGSEGSKFRLASWSWLNLAGRHPAPRNPGGLVEKPKGFSTTGGSWHCACWESCTQMFSAAPRGDCPISASLHASNPKNVIRRDFFWYQTWETLIRFVTCDSRLDATSNFSGRLPGCWRGMRTRRWQIWPACREKLSLCLFFLLQHGRRGAGEI